MHLGLDLGISMRTANRFLSVGSRPSSARSVCRDDPDQLCWIVSTACTGMRMVRAWSAIARAMARRIHHVVRGRELSCQAAAFELVDRLFIRPMLPPGIRPSRNPAVRRGSCTSGD